MQPRTDEEQRFNGEWKMPVGQLLAWLIALCMYRSHAYDINLSVGSYFSPSVE
jgi:hypothetical protein